MTTVANAAPASAGRGTATETTGTAGETVDLDLQLARDPKAGAGRLMVLAGNRPDLRGVIVDNPGCSPELRAWVDRMGVASARPGVEADSAWADSTDDLDDTDDCLSLAPMGWEPSDIGLGDDPFGSVLGDPLMGSPLFDDGGRDGDADDGTAGDAEGGRPAGRARGGQRSQAGALPGSTPPPPAPLPQPPRPGRRPHAPRPRGRRLVRRLSRLRRQPLPAFRRLGLAATCSPGTTRRGPVDPPALLQEAMAGRVAAPMSTARRTTPGRWAELRATAVRSRQCRPHLPLPPTGPGSTALSPPSDPAAGRPRPRASARARSRSWDGFSSSSSSSSFGC